MHKRPEWLLTLHSGANGGIEMVSILQEEVKVVNIGIREFVQALDEQEVPVVHVDWRPPTEEDEEIENLLEELM